MVSPPPRYSQSWRPWSSRHRADVKHHAGGGRARLENYVPDIISHIAYFHALLDIRSAFHRRIKDTCLLARQGDDFLDPNRMLDHRRRARQHLQVTHDVQAAVD